ncbi:hypothetical protein GCM10011608_16830 [Micromonospora sonchi]|uniref:Tight adherence protein B n=1 Tax=Micromonospora sonchi TaxID=1763543 RepID=A0A917TQ90_9ACTN|nr:hypothetical protein [Micromonospora sonchi]GGM32975.1 hypothetical protein GCM10011608_16830 [Micromonospora sonchi]
MSAVHWWALAALGLVVVAARLAHKWLTGGRTRSGRRGADDPLVDWVVALRAAEAPADAPEPGGTACVVVHPRSGPGTPAIGVGPSGTSRPPGWGGSRRPPAAVSGTSAAGNLNLPVRRAPVPSGGASVPGRPGTRSVPPRRVLLLTVVLGAGLGGLLAGAVAAVALGGYGALGARALLRHGAAERAAQASRDRLDQLCALAADLRAGLPVPVAAERLGFTRPAAAASVEARRPGEFAPTAGRTPGSDRVTAHRAAAPGGHVPIDVAGQVVLNGEAVPGCATAPVTGTGLSGEAASSGGRATTEAGTPSGTDALPDRPGRLAQAAVRLADRTGAPLAELVERIEADVRSTDRGLAAAAAQAAGARATAWLLAALPLGGIGLGYGIGVDPLQVLLHTPIGGGCAIGAVALQVVGLLWADRLGTVPTGVG